MTIQSLSNAAVAGSGGCTSGSSWGSTGAYSSQAASSPQGSSQTQLSPGARLFHQLQQLEKQDPAGFQQVTSSVAGILQGQAQQAQQGGNTTEASQLNQLASAFSTASQTGNLAPVQSALQQQSSTSSGASGSSGTAAATDNDGDNDGSGSTASTTNPNLAAYQQNSSSGPSAVQNLWSLFQGSMGA